MNIQTKLLLIGLTCTIAWGGGGVAPSLAISLVTNRAALGANDYIDWSSFGPNGTSVTNPSLINSNLGNSATVSQGNPSNLIVRQQSVDWFGNFAPNDFVLYTNAFASSLTISFANPVFGAGAQIQWNSNIYPNFTANLTAFDSNNNSLGTFNLAGVSNNNADNSAIFIGVQDTTASIAKLTFSTDFPGNPAINRLSINATSVPWKTDALSVIGPTLIFGLGVWCKHNYNTKALKSHKL